MQIKRKFIMETQVLSGTWRAKGKGHLRKDLNARTEVLQGIQEFYPIYKLRSLLATVSFWDNEKSSGHCMVVMAAEQYEYT